MTDATEDDLYAAMDWLLAGQDRIQKKLAARHLQEDALVLYDLSSSYFEGSHCPLAKLGYSRDGKRGTLQVNYGLLTDGRFSGGTWGMVVGHVAPEAYVGGTIALVKEGSAGGKEQAEGRQAHACYSCPAKRVRKDALLFAVQGGIPILTACLPVPRYPNAVFSG